MFKTSFICDMCLGDMTPNEKGDYSYTTVTFRDRSMEPNGEVTELGNDKPLDLCAGCLETTKNRFKRTTRIRKPRGMVEGTNDNPA